MTGYDDEGAPLLEKQTRYMREIRLAEQMAGDVIARLHLLGSDVLGALCEAVKREALRRERSEKGRLTGKGK